jgi:alanyl-tRNA synthetase
LRRDAIRRNHSATHLLHHALRKHLGEHVLQKGSLVAPDRLRFDFSHNRALSSADRRAIEAEVNRMVLSNAPTKTEEMAPDEAKRAGAIGLFEAKYGERVRVVRIADHSVELCGGTHVANAGDIGAFAIVGESSIAQGVRRIEAVTGMGAVEHLGRLSALLDDAKETLQAHQIEDIPARIAKLQAELRAQGREIEKLRQQLATGGAAADAGPTEVDGVKLFVKRVAVGDPKALRSAADALRDKLRSGVVVLGGEHDGKAALLVAVTKDLGERVHAGKLVAELASVVGGKGGGRPDLAQAGGPDLAALDGALAAAPQALQRMLAAS